VGIVGGRAGKSAQDNQNKKEASKTKYKMAFLLKLLPPPPFPLFPQPQRSQEISSRVAEVLIVS